MKDPTEKTRISDRIKESADIDHAYRNAIRDLLIINSNYESDIDRLHEEFTKMESKIRFSYESKKAKITHNFTAEKSHLCQSFQNILEDLERRKNDEISNIKARSSMMREEMRKIADISSKTMDRAHLALDKVNLRHLLSVPQSSNPKSNT